MVHAMKTEAEPNSAAPVWSLVFAGSLASMAASLILCHSALIHKLSWSNPLLAAVLCVVGSVSGAAGVTWFFWPLVSSVSSLRSGLVILNSAVAWVWMPPIVLLFQENSTGAVWISAVAAGMLALCLRNVILPPPAIRSAELQPPAELFAASLRPEPWSWHALATAVCLYASIFAIKIRSVIGASILLAIVVFILAWQLAPAAEQNSRINRGASVWKLAGASLAVLITAVILLPRMRSSSFAYAANVSSRKLDKSVGGSAAIENAQSVERAPAYAGIILWPVARKKVIVPPVLSWAASLNRRLAKPLTIPFDGPYWYFQVPGGWPGARAHVAHGDPTAVSIHSNDLLPLVMEAHQTLGSSIDLSNCGQIQVTLKNRDRRPGRIALGIVVTDSTAAGKTSLYLGEKPILSSGPTHPSAEFSREGELITFQVPTSAKIHQFDEITVLFFPDTERSTVGSRIAIQQFELIPR
jgi:hypothetical protein